MFDLVIVKTKRVNLFEAQCSVLLRRTYNQIIQNMKENHTHTQCHTKLIYIHTELYHCVIYLFKVVHGHNLR